MPRYSTRAPSTAPCTRPSPVTGRDGPYLGQRRGTVAHRIFGRGPRLARSGSTSYYSLEEAMDISGDELKSLISLMRAKAFAHLDRALPLGQQDPARLARYIEECSSLRELQRYRDGLRCWPAKIYAKIYLSRTSTRLQRSNFSNSQPEAEPDEPVAVPAQTPRPSQNSSSSSGSVATGSSLQIDSDDLDSTGQTISFGSSQEQRRESKSPVRSPSDGSSSSQAADASSASTSATHSIPLASVPSSAVEDSVVREFVLRMHPPQPQLHRVLLDAGVETTSHLEFLARETSRAKVFLGRLLEKNKINDFEYTYLDAAIKVL